LNWNEARCAWCGVVRIEGDQYSVGIDSTTGSCYRCFVCPGCGRDNRQTSSPSDVAALVRLGARVILKPERAKPEREFVTGDPDLP